ncbi:MAG: YciI family protein [Deltaproteobacteria bacterium]|nr:YciI family protein [Deltaproteobacteria bacterium]
MQYMLLIYESEASFGKMSEQERGAIFGEYMKLTEDIRKSGNFVAGAPLRPTPTATTVRVRAGKRLTTDGPFAETKEQLGGYYLVEAKDLDEAIAIAARIPSARVGSIEVRPVMAMNG